MSRGNRIFFYLFTFREIFEYILQNMNIWCSACQIHFYVQRCISCFHFLGKMFFLCSMDGLLRIKISQTYFSYVKTIKIRYKLQNTYADVAFFLDIWTRFSPWVIFVTKRKEKIMIMFSLILKVRLLKYCMYFLSS